MPPRHVSAVDRRCALEMADGLDKIQIAHLGGVNFDVGGRRSHEVIYKPTEPKLPVGFGQ